MRIGELSRLTGVSERSLRHYEQKGLLHSKRLDNGYRDFDSSAVERVKTIQLYLGLGLNTEQIEGILRCKDQEGIPLDQEERCDELRSLYRSKLEEINRQIRLLQEVKSKLEQRLKHFEEKPNTYHRKEAKYVQS